jgi:hypothetical protein
MDNAAWTKVGVTVTANQEISPDGNTSADYVQYSGGSTELRQNIPSTTAGTVSVYVKGTAGQTIKYGVTGDEGIYTLTGDWQRLQRTFAGTSAAITINTYSGATARNIYIWGAQVEVGAYPTSYIPTLGTSVTRVADASRTTGLSSLIGQTEGTIFLDLNYLPLQNTSRAICVTETAVPVNNRLIVRINNTNSRVSVISRQANTTTNGSISESALTVLLNGRNKIALGYKSGDSVLYINGVSVATNTQSFTFAATLNDLFLMTSELSLVSEDVGIVNNSALYKNRLSNTELAQLTTL